MCVFSKSIIDWSSMCVYSSELIYNDWFGWLLFFDATFNIISAILWRSVVLVEETGVSGENHRSVANHGQTLSHNVVSSSLSKKLPYIVLHDIPLSSHIILHV